MSASTPLQCKNEGKNIRGFNQQAWNDQAKSLCGPGLEAKFTQNEWLRKLLVSTGTDILVEACHDKVWGSGKPLFHLDCTDQNKWSTPGQPGILGELLMSIRNTLNNVTVSPPLVGPTEVRAANISPTQVHMETGVEEGELPHTQHP